jgi:hypothetical protein
VEPRIADVEVLKKKARKLAATQVLAGGSADVCLELGAMRGSRVCIRAGYGAQSDLPQAQPADRLLWILDGYLDLESAAGTGTRVSQGESTVLAGGQPVRLVFPTLTIYLHVEAQAA